MSQIEQLGGLVYLRDVALEDVMAGEVDSPSSNDMNEDDEAVQHQSLWNEFALSDVEDDDPCFANICGFDEIPLENKHYKTKLRHQLFGTERGFIELTISTEGEGKN